MSQISNEDFISLQHHFIDQRPTMGAHNTDPLAVIRLLEAEIAEFKQAYEEELSVDDIAHEAADLAIFVITLFKSLNLDIHREVTKKIKRNELKYPAEIFQNTSFEIGAAAAKQKWIEYGGDERFFREYVSEEIE